MILLPNFVGSLHDSLRKSWISDPAAFWKSDPLNILLVGHFSLEVSDTTTSLVEIRAVMGTSILSPH